MENSSDSNDKCFQDLCMEHMPELPTGLHRFVVFVDGSLYFTKPLVCKDNLYFIPGFDGYVISKETLEVFGPRGKVATSETQSAGYSTVRVNGKNELHHRLVALAFIPNLKDKPLINHIDGDKRNNKPANLEWVSYAENSKHAFKHGLRKDNNFVVLTCMKTGKKFSHVSQADAATFLDRNPASFSEALDKNGNGMEYCGYQVHLVDIDGNLVNYSRNKMPPRFKVVSINGDNEETYNSIRHAEKVTGINSKRIARCIKTMEPYQGFMFKKSA